MNARIRGTRVARSVTTLIGIGSAAVALVAGGAFWHSTAEASAASRSSTHTHSSTTSTSTPSSNSTDDSTDSDSSISTGTSPVTPGRSSDSPQATSSGS